MIEIKDLCKSFNGVSVVDHINLIIDDGEFMSLLGPNGAGKTTLIKLITTLLLPDSGQILVDGDEIGRERQAVKKKFSVISQEFSLRNDITAYEVLEQHGRLYGMCKADIKVKAKEWLEFCELTDSKDKIVRHLSGGMKRKIMLCRALMTDPQYLLLDEPTVGLDPVSRRHMWSLLYRLNENGMTILLTTHYIEEAQYLSKNVALLDKGIIKTVEKPEVLIHSLGNYTVETFSNGDIHSRHFAYKENALSYMSGIEGKTTLRETTLEDVFIAFAGKGIADGYNDSALGKVD